MKKRGRNARSIVMKRTKRLRLLCAQLLPCDTFADVGCDHGYCTQYMFENGLCRRAVISDVSEKSLRKAEKLLSAYISAGVLTSVCCMGLERIPADTEQVLIAGMGGEEILAILRAGFFPEKLLLQPMRHSPKVRAYLLENGYTIDRDFTFEDGKYYDVIRAAKVNFDSGAGGRRYKEAELEFGYDNIHSPSADFARKVEEDIRKCEARLERAGRPVPAVEQKLCRLTEIRNDVTGSL